MTCGRGVGGSFSFPQKPLFRLGLSNLPFPYAIPPLKLSSNFGTNIFLQWLPWLQPRSPLEAQRAKLTPPKIASAEGKIEIVAVMSISTQFSLGGERWLRQFLFGIDMAGQISQRFRYPVSRRANDSSSVPVPEITTAARQRSSDSTENGEENPHVLRAEDSEQVGKGRLSPPFQLASKDGASTLTGPSLNVAFRFGVEQGAKLRACGDLRHPKPNLACAVSTPFKLALWGDLDGIYRSINNGLPVWIFSKADREASYKQLPLNEGHSKLAVIALWRPAGGRRYGFFSRTMMFGAVAAVVRYSLFAMLLTELASKRLGIPPHMLLRRIRI